MAKQTKILVNFIALLASAVFFGQTWQSSIVYFDANGKLGYALDAEQNRVIDFSAAGYKNSNEQIPNVNTIITTILPSTGDRTTEINAAIQSALNTAPNANGFRGVILLKAGNYEIQGTLKMNVSGVVLRGEGSGLDGTVITATGNTPDKRTVINVGGGTNVAWKKLGTLSTNITTAFVKVGSFTFNVASTAGFAVGDAIIIYHPSTASWLTAIDNGGVDTAAPWTAGTKDIQMNKIITAINGNSITIESPVTNHLDLLLSQSYIYKVNKATTKSLIGVENLRIDIQNWTNVTDEDHAWQGITMFDIEDSWVRNVVALHFGQSGFKSGTATRVTFDNCQALVPVASLNGSKRDNFQADKFSSNILFKNCLATKARHAFEVSGTSSATGIVFTRCTSIDATNPSEGHFHWSTGILFDCFRDYGNQTDIVLGLYNRGSYGTNHGWAAAHSVAWNCDLRRTTIPNGDLICQKPPTAQNFVIGGFGRINYAAPFPQYPFGYVEGFNNSTATLNPESLFDAQLSERQINLSTTNNSENNIAELDIQLYPNPVTNVVTINSKSEITQMEVYTTIGQLLYLEKLNNFKTTVDLSNYSNGNYFIKIKTENRQKSFKIIKK